MFREESEESMDTSPSAPWAADENFAPSNVVSKVNITQAATRGIARTIGILPSTALLTVGMDVMLHGADVVSAGMLIPFSLLAGIGLGYYTYKTQKGAYGDEDEAAKAKAVIVALLTAIPSPLPYILFIPAGIAGWLRRKA